MELFDALYENHLVVSKAEFRRLVYCGGIKINDEVVKDENLHNSIEVFNGDKINIGKSKSIIIKEDLL